VRRLPTNFTPEELRPILLRAGSRFSGKLRSLFVVLDDDAKVTREIAATGAEDADADGAEGDSTVVEVQSGPSSVNPRKRGADSVVRSKSKK
jgi:hypothetical protein